MYTRCPGCHTVYQLNAALLASGAGRYRCGQCGKEGNALECLFDEWPEPGATEPAIDSLQTQQLSLNLDATARSLRDPAATEPPEPIPIAMPPGRAGRGTWLRPAWAIGLALILLIIAIQWLRFLNEPLSAQSRSADEQRGMAAGAEQPPGGSGWIHLVSRELRSHPTLPGTLQLTATIVNRADGPQPYPLISVTLLDAAGQPVHRQRFAPADYLPEGAADEDGMAPEAYLPLTLEFDDPGRQAVGFELEFE